MRERNLLFTRRTVLATAQHFGWNYEEYPHSAALCTEGDFYSAFIESIIGRIIKKDLPYGNLLKTK